MIKILVDSWGETLYRPLNAFLDNIKIFGVSADHGYKTSYNELFCIRKILKKDNDYDVLFINSWHSIFLLPFFSFPGKKIIFVSHGTHFPITFKYSMLNSNKFLIKIFILFTYPLFKILYILGLKKVDLYLVVHNSTLLESTKRYNSKWLPNPVDTSLFHKRKNCFKLDNSYINIFYPTSFREVKNPNFALDLMFKLKQRYKRIRFYIIKQSVSNFSKYLGKINKIRENIIWINQLKREELPFYYSANWDCVLGSFYPGRTYAVLNMIELEAMACKAPIICLDLNEILFFKLHEIEEVVIKLIEDNTFRKWYVDRNYRYVLSKHSGQSVAKILKSYIDGLCNGQ